MKNTLEKCPRPVDETFKKHVKQFCERLDQLKNVCFQTILLFLIILKTNFRFLDLNYLITMALFRVKLKKGYNKNNLFIKN